MRSSDSYPAIVRRWLRMTTVAATLLMGLTASPLDAASALPLHATRQGATDLAIKGELAGFAAGEIRYARWADLAALPNSKLTLTGEFVPGEQEVTVVYLADLWAALPRRGDADTLLATCTDGYAAVFRTGFVDQYRPFLMLAINGRGPEHWPPPGLTFNPGPYVISVSSKVVPAVAELLDAGHKRPWGVTTLEVTRHDESFAVFFKAPWTGLSSRAKAGRELWIDSCASCHQGPQSSFGGTKSNVPFEILAARAQYAPEVFKGYIRDPKAFVANAKMEPHPHYTDTQLAALRAFVVAEPDR